MTHKKVLFDKTIDKVQTVTIGFWGAIVIGLGSIVIIIVLITTAIIELSKYLGTKTHSYNSYNKIYDGVSEHQSRKWAREALPRYAWWCETIVIAENDLQTLDFIQWYGPLQHHKSDSGWHIIGHTMHFLKKSDQVLYHLTF